ncbi:hypothetical protein COV81_01125 [Candidatus Peregrinibacteria bacterium CG11_big_fil_rev_8_21_14_0_20_41_10]|nr:MAG: hypothetical protein COV81_01125 [Candidatus Peregrinibacteria bacterium CG11_big_fil_rev_8_21_14_0_20_41_10]PJC37839.1 MAG: hypothetical protein CO045_03405 [Candidatus Peregrinibacteria bacterium CG_4_9_14_0_2_um_filter_41_14]
MTKITFIKDGNELAVDAKDGATVLQTALDNNINMDHACGGNGVCTTCMIKVHDGAENLGEMTESEEMMGMDPGDMTTRLGCQCEIAGDAKVEPAF